MIKGKPAVSREEEIRRIREQIEIGRDIRDQRIFSTIDLERVQEKRAAWLETNARMFTHLFGHSLFDEESNKDLSFDMNSAITFGLKEKYFKDDINEQIGKLESFLENLKRMPESKAELLMEQRIVEEPIRQAQPGGIEPGEARSREAQTKEVKQKEEPLIEKPFTEKVLKKKPSKELPPKTEHIVLIHGRDQAAKESLLKFIEKLGLRALILREQTNGSRGIIEKFGEISNINFAVFLFTPDDIAAPQDESRERLTHTCKNLIFEFGYLVGKLGHGRVCALYKDGAEMLSDYSGALTIPLDDRGGWKLLVAKEIKQAGIEIDLNKAI